LSTPIEQTAAFKAGVARGFNNAALHSRDRIAGIQNDIRNNRLSIATSREVYARDQAIASLSTLEKVQLGLDIAGASEIPVVSQIADLSSGGISLYQGDYVGAALSAGSAIPIVGKAFEGTRAARTAAQLAARAEAATNIRQAKNILNDALRGSPNFIKDRNSILRSFDLETFRVEKVAQTRTEFRVFDDLEARLRGRFTSTDLFDNRLDTITNLALPKNSVTRLAEVTIPQGSVVFTGKVAPQIKVSSGLIGGGNQSFLTGSLDKFTFTEVFRRVSN
jgi:hypothetical protein